SMFEAAPVPIPPHMLSAPAVPTLHQDPTQREPEEKEQHRRYMYGFRVRVCKAYLESRCPNDAYTCFDTHARVPSRRKPQLQHGRFNYIPTRCRYVVEEKDCPQGPQCRFSAGSSEVIYHPSKYKTQLCNHSLDEN